MQRISITTKGQLNYRHLQVTNAQYEAIKHLLKLDHYEAKTDKEYHAIIAKLQGNT